LFDSFFFSFFVPDEDNFLMAVDFSSYLGGLDLLFQWNAYGPLYWLLYHANVDDQHDGLFTPVFGHPEVPEGGTVWRCALPFLTHAVDIEAFYHMVTYRVATCDFKASLYWT
jgi:hypothetical protein